LSNLPSRSSTLSTSLRNPADSLRILLTLLSNLSNGLSPLPTAHCPLLTAYCLLPAAIFAFERERADPDTGAHSDSDTCSNSGSDAITYAGPKRQRK